MKVTLKNIKFSEHLSEETNAFTADVYVDGKKCGYAKNDGHGGNTYIQPYPEYKDLFRDGEKFLLTQPKINIGTEEKPYLVDCNMESMVDKLFEDWLNEKERKMLEKKMENSLLWGVPNGSTIHVIKFKKKLSEIPKPYLQQLINNTKKEFKEGEKYLNTNLDGFDL